MDTVLEEYGLPKAYERVIARSRQNLCTGCMEFYGASNEKGYGIIKIGNKSRKAHRISYEFFNGSIPEGKSVLHHCDNPCCVAKEHLYVGTNDENLMDKMSRNRSGKKLDISTAKTVKKLLSEGIQSGAEIARTFGITKQAIYAIKSGKNWSHVEV